MGHCYFNFKIGNYFIQLTKSKEFLIMKQQSGCGAKVLYSKIFK